MTDEAADVLQVAPPVVAEERLRALLQHAWASDASAAPTARQRARPQRARRRRVRAQDVQPGRGSDRGRHGGRRHGARLPSPSPSWSVPATVPAVDGASGPAVSPTIPGRNCLARLITVLPGSPLEGEPITVDLAEQVGAAGRAGSAPGSQGFFHPGGRPGSRLGRPARSRGGTPDRDRIRARAGCSPARIDTGARDEPAVARRRPARRRHADQRAGRRRRVTGLIDFGDMHHTAAACDLAVSLTSVLRNTATAAGTTSGSLAAAVLLGYQRHRPLTAGRGGGARRPRPRPARPDRW